MATIASIQTALENGKRVFALAADGGYDLVKSVDEVQSFDDKQLMNVRIEKDVEPKFVVGHVTETALMTLDHEGKLTPEINAGKRYFERKARVEAAKAGLNAIISVTNPLVYDEETGEISYPAVVGEVISL